MAIKKSDLYSSLWQSCDELRGGMDASQYKDYVLFMLFIKYISDKYGESDDFAPPVSIPKGASFKDMIANLRSGDVFLSRTAPYSSSTRSFRQVWDGRTLACGGLRSAVRNSATT